MALRMGCCMKMSKKLIIIKLSISLNNNSIQRRQRLSYSPLTILMMRILFLLIISAGLQQVSVIAKGCNVLKG